MPTQILQNLYFVLVTSRKVLSKCGDFRLFSFKIWHNFGRFFSKKILCTLYTIYFWSPWCQILPPKKTLVSIAQSQEKKEEAKVARLLYFASIGSQKYKNKMMIKNLCFIFDLWPDLAKSLQGQSPHFLHRPRDHHCSDCRK